MTKIYQLSIPEIKCNGCVAAIKSALDKAPGIHKAVINLDTKSALVEADVTQARLLKVIKNAGFEAIKI